MLWAYLFLLCYAQFLGAAILRIFKGYETKTLYTTIQIADGLTLVNSLLNRILYCVKMRPIRKAMLSMFPENLRSFLHLSLPQS